MSMKILFALVVVVLLGIGVRWLGMVFDVCFAALLVALICVLFKRRKRPKQ